MRRLFTWLGWIRAIFRFRVCERALTTAVNLVDVLAAVAADIVTVTLTTKWPTAEYVCRPITEKSPFAPLTVPRLTLPSPQWMIAAKLPAAVRVFASVKVATVPVNDSFLVAAMLRDWDENASARAPVSALAGTLAGESPSLEAATMQYV